jgi:acetylornithine deacetylase
MSIDSTSGREKELAYYVKDNFKTDKNTAELQDVGDGTYNVFFKWGSPGVIFCTHLDTVPPYIPPRAEGDMIFGRGSCDAKGQITAMYEACLQLEKQGNTDFGLLLLAGEEIGSTGGPVANKLITGCKYTVIGEPTENKLISAGKGTKHFEVLISGKNAHSGYPHMGDNAIETMRNFLNLLAVLEFPEDPVLGKTTYNIGKLSADNAVNVVPASVSFKLMYRTSFASDHLVAEKLLALNSDKISVKFLGGDQPIRFEVFDGKGNNIVAYGTDAPSLPGLGKKVLFGPGSIFHAHTDNEQIRIQEMEEAVIKLKDIYFKIKKKLLNE